MPKEQREQMEAVSRQFEAIFVNQLVSEMRKTVHKNDFFKESHAEKVFQGMLDSEYAQKVAQSDQLGLAQLIYQHLLEKR